MHPVVSENSYWIVIPLCGGSYRAIISSQILYCAMIISLPIYLRKRFDISLNYYHIVYKQKSDSVKIGHSL